MTTKKYSPDEAAQRRFKLLDESFVPLIRRAFRKHPQLQSAVMLVAQYWCDEAEDAVHCELLFSQLPTPDIAAANAARKAEDEADGYDFNAPAPKERPWHRWFPALRPQPPLTEQELDSQVQALRHVNLPPGIDPMVLERETMWEVPWDSNEEAISLFAAFCLEDCHQEMEPGEAYAPYAIFRRQGTNVEVEVVGTMRRPWLDGVLPSWQEQQQDGDDE